VEIMQSFRTSRFRVGTPLRVVRSRHLSRQGLGCVAVRRITDDAGRAWRVREFRSHSGLGLFFRCEVPGIRAETRAASAALESMDDERLVDLLQSGAE
jgi:hypothetical protein